MSDRDTQRVKLYRAEREAFNGRPFRDVSTPALYEARVRAILRSKWMRTTYPDAPHGIDVEYSAQMRGATAYRWHVRTGTRSMVEWILVHELAHIVHSNLRPTLRWDDTAHGRQYAEVYVKMTRRFLGAEAYRALRKAFRKHRVKVGPYRKPKTIVDNSRFLKAWASRKADEK